MPEATVSPRELQRQEQREQRRAQAAALAGAGGAPATVDFTPRLSHQARVLQQAFPPSLVEQGLVERQTGQANRGLFDPELFARNPQHGRVVERIVNQIAQSFSAHGQQEPILARLITQADRELWPETAGSDQLFFIVDGHQRCAAVAGSSLDRVWAEIVLPEDGESPADYRRRCLTMASIKMMQSQAYDIFDKVNQVKIWMLEFAVNQLPSKRELSATFHISGTEAQRIRTVTRLAPAVEAHIKQADNKPADEVIAMIASYPMDEQMDAFERLGKMPVSQARQLIKEEKATVTPTPVSGRPRNYIYRLNDPDNDIVSVVTRLTPEQWKARGGTRHFWECVQKIGHDREHQDHLKDDLD
jgi:hypothetical protein